ncbi:MAG: hypothetical protein LPK85_05540 [Gammaproteobacteria bacterium]|nr:hypothetical protein [Gammaproteobacteria bacterium]
MPASFLEIIELPNGDFALRRADDRTGPPLVRISFSSEAREMLQDNELNVARAMINAGIEAAGALSDDMREHDFDELEDDPVLHTLH